MKNKAVIHVSGDKEYGLGPPSWHLGKLRRLSRSTPDLGELYSSRKKPGSGVPQTGGSVRISEFRTKVRTK